MMKKIFLIFINLVIFLACEKDDIQLDTSVEQVPLDYIIKQGRHYSSFKIKDMTGDKKISGKFLIESPIYRFENNNPNQRDWNKLIGFSDCNTVNAFIGMGAMIGWRWTVDKKQGTEYLEFAAYVHNASDKSREYKAFDYRGYEKDINNYSAGTPTIDFYVGIDPQNPNNYLFKLDGQEIIMSGDQGRGCNASVIIGHLHHPWFGGQEVAPHDIYFYFALDGKE